MRDDLHIAREHLLNGSYGKAAYHALKAFYVSRSIGQLELELDSWDTLMTAVQMAKQQFEMNVSERNITLTPENVLYMADEHSTFDTDFESALRDDGKKARVKKTKGLEELTVPKTRNRVTPPDRIPDSEIMKENGICHLYKFIREIYIN